MRYPRTKETFIVPNPEAGDAFGVDETSHLVPVRKSRKVAERFPITTPTGAARYLSPLSKGPVERLLTVPLDAQGRPLGAVIAAQGTVNESMVHPREVFAPAVQARASGVLIAHNHPSGSCKESGADVSLTERLHEAGRLLGVPLVDHVVVGDGCTTSLRNKYPHIWNKTGEVVRMSNGGRKKLTPRAASTIARWIATNPARAHRARVRAGARLRQSAKWLRALRDPWADKQFWAGELWGAWAPRAAIPPSLRRRRNPSEFRRGLRVEREHLRALGGSTRALRRLVADHLREHPRYYSRLARCFKNPARSPAQRRLFGAALGCRRTGRCASDKVARLSRLPLSTLRAFARNPLTAPEERHIRRLAAVALRQARRPAGCPRRVALARASGLYDALGAATARYGRITRYSRAGTRALGRAMGLRNPLWKRDKVTGTWDYVRDVTPETAAQWLAIFQKDEPNETFKVAAKRPSWKKKNPPVRLPHKFRWEDSWVPSLPLLRRIGGASSKSFWRVGTQPAWKRRNPHRKARLLPCGHRGRPRGGWCPTCERVEKLIERRERRAIAKARTLKNPLPASLVEGLLGGLAAGVGSALVTNAVKRNNPRRGRMGRR